MINKEVLMIPGPTPLPPRVVSAMTHPMVNHRGPVFRKIFAEIRELTKSLLNEPSEVFLVGSSGTGAMELAIQNFSKRGSEVLVVDTGFFGERFYKIAKAYERNALRLEVPWGRSAKKEEILESLKNNSNVETVFLTHNETSSTVINDIAAISKAIREVSNALTVVDGISSMGIARIDMKNSPIDVVLGASQKGLMSPPGIGLVALSQRALEYASSNDSGSFYFDIKELKRNGDMGDPFTTFPVSTAFGLREGLKMLFEEGLENVYKRHETYRKLVRESLSTIGLKFVADDVSASPCVTGVYAPEGVNADEIVDTMRRRYNIEIARIQGKLRGKAFRIGHMGFVNSNDLLVTVAALESTLKDLGFDFPFGSATCKFIEIRRNFEV